MIKGNKTAEIKISPTQEDYELEFVLNLHLSLNKHDHSTSKLKNVFIPYKFSGSGKDF